MIPTKLLLLFAIFTCLSCVAKPVDCSDGQSYAQIDFDRLTHALSTREWHPEIAKYIDFPVNVLINGNIEKYRSAFELELDWVSIMTPSVVKFLKSTDKCSIAKILKLVSESNRLRVNSLVFPYDKNDVVLASYGISSLSAYRQFITDINDAIEQKKYASVAQSINYPFYVDVKGKAVKIVDSIMFLQHSEYIINKKFVSLLKRANNLNALNTHPRGLMLNQEGSIWVIQIEERILLDIVNLQE